MPIGLLSNKKMSKKPRVLITFRENGQNGGPYVSHERIVESNLKGKYEFIPLLVPRASELSSVSGMRRFVHNIKKSEPDFVHIAGLQIEGFLVTVACMLAGVNKRVVAVHGSSLEAIEFSPYKKNVVKLMERFTLRFAIRWYGVSEYATRMHMLSDYSKNCFGYIYNLPQVEIYEPSNTSFRSEMGFSEDDVVIASTGRITVEKGFPVLFEAMGKIKTSQRVRFLIVGEGPFLDEMKQKSGEINNCTVHFLGYRNDVPHILESCDIFVICTLHETLCNSILEANTLGIPAVASNVGGIPEIICHGENGYLTPVGDSGQVASYLEKLVEDQRLRIDMGQKAKAVIEEKFKREVIVKKIDEMYEEVLKK